MDFTLTLCIVMSVVPVDLKELALSLQKLPLALRLNLEQKQMQVPFPVEFPATSRKPKLEAGIIGQVRPVEKMQTDNCGCLLPATALHNVSDSKENDPPQISKSRPLTEHLNEELDFLLTSHTPGKNLNESQGIEFCKGKTSVPVLDLEGDLKLQPFEADQIKSDTGTRREATEDLEDWLDTMIL
ncbi:cell death regulator Aven [Arapaima gigas]